MFNAVRSDPIRGRGPHQPVRHHPLGPRQGGSRSMNVPRVTPTARRVAAHMHTPRDASRPRLAPCGRMAGRLVPLLAIVLSATPESMRPAFAANSFLIETSYYVDQANPSCSNVGPGTQAQPYCAISVALAAHHDAGTTIHVMPGHYREQVTFPASGAPGSPISLVAETARGPVIVDGTDDFTSPTQWAQSTGNEWLAASVTWAPVQVFADEQRLTPSTAPPGSLPPRSFTWVSGSGLYVNVGGGNPEDHGAQVGRRRYGIYASGKSWLRIQGFTVVRGEDRCIQLTNGATDVEIVLNTVRQAAQMGIQAVGGSNIRIGSNVVSDNGDHGISLISGATHCTIEDNESFRNVYALGRRANGLYLFGCPGNLIQRNRWHDNQDSG